ncbi:MAG: class I tRNA ligase family protein, partial [Vicinamibacterales bacterium]
GCRACGASALTPAIVARAADVFAEHGADAWYDQGVDAFRPAGFVCEACGSDDLEQERDILDVWFDSGSSHEAVLARRPELTWPADIYLEGTDQYRGWFQSSMLVGLGTRDRAPYRSVLTHGFVVNEHGHKMSKSLGNDIPPQKVIGESGADVLRLWVSMVDYRDEVRLGKEILARTVEAYRKIRNTFKYLLSNLYDFDPAVHRLDRGALLEVDRYALALWADLSRRVREAYDTYDFQAIFQAINEFTTVHLSAFYLDVSKDRLYTLRADSRERRSAQTAQYVITDGLARLVAPILSVTADEIWSRLPGAREDSVHLAEFQAEAADWLDPALLERWTRLREVRDAVNLALEGARQQKLIGNALSAHVTVSASGALADLLEQYAADLPPLFITSTAEVRRRPSGGLEVEVAKAGGDKCLRCWRFVTDAAPDGDFEGLCGRCVEAVGGLRAAGH